MEKASLAKTWTVTTEKDDYTEEALSRADTARRAFNEYIDSIPSPLKKWGSFLFLLLKLKEMKIVDIDLHSGITIELSPELTCGTPPVDFFQEIASSISGVCEISIETMIIEGANHKKSQQRYLLSIY